MAERNPQGQQFQIKLPDDIAKGVYSNLAQIAFSSNGEEFALDFFNLLPPVPMAVARVIVTPGHMKRLAIAINENLKRYEEQFGQIKPSQAPEHKIGFRTE